MVQVLTATSDGATQFEEVFMFSHRDHAAVTKFINIHTENSSILLSPGHYIWTRAEGMTMLLKTAKTVKTGDFVGIADLPTSSIFWSPVTSILHSFQRGLYNPHTPSGSIIVNRMAAATFTNTLPPSPTLHRLATMPASIFYSTCKLLGVVRACNDINDIVLQKFFTYFDRYEPWTTGSMILSGAIFSH